MADLFSPLKIREIEFRNRLVVSPMCQYSSKDGFANDWHLVHLGSRAVGGAGLIITEATAVSPEGRISPADLGIWKDDHIDFLKRITAFISGNGSIPGIQLAHAGRKASKQAPWEGNHFISVEDGGWEVVAPSSIPFSEKDLGPIALDQSGIEKVIEDFKIAAERSIAAGFKVIEIHAAHGYLIHQFLSPLSNTRTDQYGGTFENRVRLLLEIIDAIHFVWPQTLPLFVRISASDWKEGGWTIQDSVRLSELLLHKGVDLIDCSSGGLVIDAKITLGPGYQVPFAEEVKRKTGILTGAVGLIDNAVQASQIIKNNQADLVFLARQFLRDPYFPLSAASSLHQEFPWPVQYDRAKRRN